MPAFEGAQAVATQAVRHEQIKRLFQTGQRLQHPPLGVERVGDRVPVGGHRRRRCTACTRSSSAPCKVSSAGREPVRSASDSHRCAPSARPFRTYAFYRQLPLELSHYNEKRLE